MKLPVNRALPLAALILFGSGAAFARDNSETTLSPVKGPAADYPMVVGEPFTIGSTVWTPADQLNYDAVGYATVGDATLTGVTAAHKTLPLPSYVEVTALDSGKTILVRLERRGPIVNDALIELSPMAAAQLGIVPGAHSPIRMRRVNPPEQERAMLRAGNRAPERMETPEGLLKVLRRKLADQSPLLPPPSTPPAMPTGMPAEAVPKLSAPVTKKAPQPEKTSVAGPAASAAPPVPAAVKNKPAKTTAPKSVAPEVSPARDALVVQVGAFSVEANARKIASQLGGRVDKSGKYWRVRLGPFSNRAQAAPALEKAKRAGYSDARIQSAD